VCVCVSVCTHSERWLSYPHQTSYTYTILYGSGSAYTDPEVKRSRSHGYENRHSCMVASDCCGYCTTAAASVGLSACHMTAYVSSSGDVLPNLLASTVLKKHNQHNITSEHKNV